MTTPEIHALSGAQLNVAIAEAKGWRGGKYHPSAAYCLIRPGGKTPFGCDEVPLAEAVANRPTFGVYDLVDSIPAWTINPALAYDLREEIREAGCLLVAADWPGDPRGDRGIYFRLPTGQTGTAFGANEHEATGRAWLLAYYANAFTPNPQS